MNEKNQEVAQLRTDNMNPLKNLANEIVRLLYLTILDSKMRGSVSSTWACP